MATPYFNHIADNSRGAVRANAKSKVHVTASLLARLVIIIVHEMVHLLERLHNDRFVTYMDEFMPQWRRCQDELNKGPLAYAHLGY
jgi:hypothetical protein